jgi:hypothetical protein
MATPSPDHLGPGVVRAPDPWTYKRDHTWLALELLGEEGPAHLDVVLYFLINYSLVIMYKLFPCDYSFVID